MKFPAPLTRGRLLRRYKRFLADIEMESGAPHYLAIPYNNGPKRVAGVFAHQIRSGLVDVTGAIVADLRLPASEAAVEVPTGVVL